MSLVKITPFQQTNIVDDQLLFTCQFPGRTESSLRKLERNPIDDTIHTAGFSTDSPKLLTLAKWKQDGTLCWNKQYTHPTITNDIPLGHGITFDASGNIYITGFFTATDQQSYVFKFDPNGNLIWQREVSEANRDCQIRDVAVDSSNNVWLAGSLVDSDSSSGQLLLTLNSVGTVTQKKQFVSGTGSLSGIDFDSSGNIIVCGYEQNANQDAYVAKLDSTASTFIWQKTLDGSFNDQGRPFYINSNDDVIIAVGSRNTTGGPHHPVTVKLSGVDGSIIWQRENTSVGAPNPYFGGIVGDPVNDDVYNFGYVDTVQRGVILKYNNAGVLQWQREIDGTYRDLIQGAALVGNSLYFGSFTNSATFGTNTEMMFGRIKTDGTSLGTFSDKFVYNETTYDEVAGTLSISNATRTISTPIGPTVTAGTFTQNTESIICTQHIYFDVPSGDSRAQATINPTSAATITTGDYFELEGHYVPTYVWFNVAGGGGDPALGGNYTGIEIPLTGMESSSAVANEIARVLNRDGIEWGVAADDGTAVIYNNFEGFIASPVATDGNTGFPISTTGNGSIVTTPTNVAIIFEQNIAPYNLMYMRFQANAPYSTANWTALPGTKILPWGAAGGTNDWLGAAAIPNPSGGAFGLVRSANSGIPRQGVVRSAGGSNADGPVDIDTNRSISFTAPFGGGMWVKGAFSDVANEYFRVGSFEEYNNLGTAVDPPTDSRFTKTDIQSQPLGSGLSLNGVGIVQNGALLLTGANMGLVSFSGTVIRAINIVGQVAIVMGSNLWVTGGVNSVAVYDFTSETIIGSAALTNANFPDIPSGYTAIGIGR